MIIMKMISNKYLLPLFFVVFPLCFCCVAVAQENVAMHFAARPMSASDFAVAGAKGSGGLLFESKKLDADVSYVYPGKGSVSYVGLDADFLVMDNLAVSLDAAYGMGKSYDTYNISGIRTGSFKPGELMLKFGAGYRFTQSLAANVRLGYLSESLAENASYGAFAADLSVNAMFSVSDMTEVAAEAGVYNVGTAVSSASGQKFGLPSSVGLGGGLIQNIGEKNSLQVLARLDYYFHSAVSASLGLDFCVADMISVRAGYRYGGKSVLPSFMSLGLGVKFAGVRLDLAYLTASPLSNTIALGLGYSF